jgi:hypothetical protein
MRRGFGRVGSALLNALLPQTRAQACTDSFCEHRAGKGHRCCMICTSGKVCSPWHGANSCAGVSCP